MRSAVSSAGRPAVALLLLWLAAAGCGPPPVPERAPNLVLVTVDTLRADRLGAYGSTTTRTPHIDRLAAEGTLFLNAAAPMPVTRPSHFTILTGRYPREHGVTDNDLALPESELTVAEVLRAAGYRTGAFTGVGLLNRASGAAQGFDTFEPPGRGRGPLAADEVVHRAAEWLRAGDPDRPFFLWVHVFDPHMPYAPPAVFRPPGPGPDAVGWETLREMAKAGGGDVGRRDFERAVALYGGEVEAVDAAFGLLDLELEARGGAGGTVTVLTADHGECFENGNFFRHAGCLYDGAIRVPLVVRYPGRIREGERVATTVEHVDLAATLLSLAGVPVPESFGGHPLFEPDGSAADMPEERYALIEHPFSRRSGFAGRRSLWRGIDSVMGEPLRPMVHSAEIVGLRSAHWKYLATRGRGESLYDLANDPWETRDVAPERPEEVRRLRSLLRRKLEEHPLTLLEPGELDPALREQLEALGYL